MKVLFIGDIVGKPGRTTVNKLLPRLVDQEQVEMVIANGENSAGGAGITEKVFRELQSFGIDIITGGNHSWDRKDIYDFIDREPTLLRPANFPLAGVPGSGRIIYQTKTSKLKVAVINLLGRVFMGPVDCPFQVVERELAALNGETDIIIVDFHAEATSEKQAMGWYLDGKVSAVIGTHSHVQTADQRLLKQGTAYMSDAGMTGLYDSILGVDIEGPMQRFITRLPHRLSISGGKTIFNGSLLDIDEANGKAKSIKRISTVIDLTN